MVMQVRTAFRCNAHLTDAGDILKAKQQAISGIGMYYQAMAQKLAEKEREQTVEVLPQTLMRHRANSSKRRRRVT
jgi:hypothetical protein